MLVFVAIEGNVIVAVVVIVFVVVVLLRPVHCAVGLEYLGLGVVYCDASK